MFWTCVNRQRTIKRTGAKHRNSIAIPQTPAHSRKNSKPASIHSSVESERIFRDEVAAPDLRNISPGTGWRLEIRKKSSFPLGRGYGKCTVENFFYQQYQVEPLNEEIERHSLADSAQCVGRQA